MKRYFAAVLAMSMVLACGCAANTKKEETDTTTKMTQVSEEKAQEAVTFTDDMGREVTVENPQRVVCLISSFSDIWCLAGGADQIVAATDATWKYFDLPLREDVVNLGPAKDVNMEQLIACEPDFVLASCGTDRNVELEATLDEMGINTAYFNVDNFEDYLRVLDICTQLTGHKENYKTYGTDVKKQVEEVRKRVDGRKPSVLYVRATGSSCKVKNSEESVLGEMLADLGCVNIADQDNRLLEQLSVEKIIEQDPDYIFVVIQGSDPTDAEMILESTLLSNPAWETLTAVKEGRYYVMDPNLYNMKPNARWGEAYEKLADILYSEK